ncbi:ArsR/SmtB family transcription factor [Rhizorhabdus argentea]|uniref:ArsR/SmtB family transcription factor n=1 Tax=Rhizorhabdus argentea TaxID=1387174 RepID=UPI0030EF813C
MIGMLGALGQHTRFRLVTELLASDSGRMSVNALADAVGILQNSASAHLAILARAGVIGATRHGKQRLYHIDEQRLRWLISAISSAFIRQDR